MVGLVLVCHSAKLAEGAAELAVQMGGEGLKIAVAGGLEQPGDSTGDQSGGAPGSLLGTDATRVARAIDEVWSEDGVLVLMDLGSAVLSAEMALELLLEERRRGVLLTAAPLVEGAVAAAVAAGLGDPLGTVAEEARGALCAKAAHLGAPAAPAPGGPGQPSPAPAAAAPAAPAKPPAPEEVLHLVVVDPLGLHLRPAAALVRTVAGFDAEVGVTDLGTGAGPASAHSLNAVATLGVRHGDEIMLSASGPQAEAALDAVRRLAVGAQGGPLGMSPADARSETRTTAPAAAALRQPTAAAESPPTPAREAPPAPAAGSVLQGIPASPGIAIGAALHLEWVAVEIAYAAAAGPDVEWAALVAALAATREDVGRSRDSLASRASPAEAGIFDAHLLFLQDEALLAPARDAVFASGRSAARAWADAVAAAAGVWEELGDPYLRARAADLRGVGDQVLRRLAGAAADGRGAAATEPPGDLIVVTAELSPAQAAALDLARVRGVACAFGGPTSHGAILARSLGVPAVVGAGRDLLGVTDGTVLALDGEAGVVTVEPPAGARRALEERRAAQAREGAEALARAAAPAVTRDGRTIRVLANVAGAADAAAAVAAGAEGAGLLRTEFLFLAGDHLPSEDEQERAYREVAEALGDRPLTLRTLDVGADKPLPFLPSRQERNPFLGVRGIRLGLAHPELLTCQLRAALRVAAGHDLRIMFPMVATVDEVREVRELLDEARASLVREGVAVPERLEAGIMVEVPAAALTAEDFVPHVDFFSIGTNDLAQYVMAAERGNAALAALVDPLHPAVLRLIERTARAAAEGGREVAVCGEAAGDPQAVPLLLGLGVTELSMAGPRIPAAKQAVRATDLGAARELAARALSAGSAAAVRELGAR